MCTRISARHCTVKSQVSQIVAYGNRKWLQAKLEFNSLINQSKVFFYFYDILRFISHVNCLQKIKLWNKCRYFPKINHSCNRTSNVIDKTVKSYQNGKCQSKDLIYGTTHIYDMQHYKYMIDLDIRMFERTFQRKQRHKDTPVSQ